MTKKDTTFIIIILIVGAILLGAKFGWFDFVITGSETMSRSYTSIVDAGSTVSVTYKVSGASGAWAASVIDTLDCPGVTIDLSDPNGWKGGIVKKFVVVSTEGTTVTQTFKMPNKEGVTCNFDGDYKFGDKAIKNFPGQTISTRIVTPICSSGADDNGDGIISRSELGIYINKWIDDDVSRHDLGEIIMEWVNGCE